MNASFGVDLGVVTGMLSVTTVKERRAFTEALVKEVGRRLGW